MVIICFFYNPLESQCFRLNDMAGPYETAELCDARGDELSDSAQRIMSELRGYDVPATSNIYCTKVEKGVIL